MCQQETSAWADARLATSLANTRSLTHQFQGVITGKGMEWGGSILRPEATGSGALYFVNEMLQTHGIDIKGKTIALSGFGNVAWGAVKKAAELGAKVITISGPDGYIYDPEGISGERNDFMLEPQGQWRGYLLALCRGIQERYVLSGQEALGAEG